MKRYSKKTILYLLAGAIISLIVLVYSGAFFVIPSLRSVSTLVIGVGFIIIHVVSVFVFARRFFQVNEIGLSLVTSLLTLIIVIQLVNMEGDWITGLWIFPLLLSNMIATATVLLVTIIVPKRPAEACYNCTLLLRENSPESQFNLEQRHDSLSEIARDSSGWYVLLRCRKCNRYWEAGYRNKSGNLKYIRELSRADAVSKYSL